MGSGFSSFACCLTDRKKGAIILPETTQYAPLLFENSTDHNDKMAANRILSILQTSATRREVQSKLQQLKKDGVFTSNWTEKLATYVLAGVTVMIQKGTDMSEVMKKTYDDVKGDYDVWKAENPEFAKIVEISAEVALTALALAVLAALLPWVIEALGFETLGPRLGSWAATWQSRYLGETPSGSLFSFLQKIGMKYGSKAIVSML